MLGAILGDIVGSPYEFDHNNYKHKDFPLLSEKSHFTDDTVMTAAVAVGLIDGKGLPERTFCAVQHEMRFWGREYPHAGYGGMFRRWLHAENPNPYGSFGNGSAMRVSAAGWLFDTLDKTLEMAKVTAEVTHNHPEGIKGAQATAAAIFLARTGHSKPEIKRYVEQTIVYDTTYRLMICILRDVTDEEAEREKKENISRQTVEIADKVVDKQMRIVQEIASLLGETAAETKIALTKLKESISDE